MTQTELMKLAGHKRAGSLEPLGKATPAALKVGSNVIGGC